MGINKRRCLGLLLVVSGSVVVFLAHGHAQKQSAVFSPVIPKTWVDAEMAKLEVSLADAASSPKHVSADYYYRIPERKIYKSYPIYHPDKEPPGYFDSLKQQEPEIAFDPAKLKTEADWIKAGELVFEAAGDPLPLTTPFTDVRNPGWYRELGYPLAKDGTLPFYRYVIRQKGRIEVTFDSCASCHTRVMSDGTVLKGAQGNLPFDRAYARVIRQRNNERFERRFLLNLYGAPWVKINSLANLEELSVADMAARLEAV